MNRASKVITAVLVLLTAAVWCSAPHAAEANPPPPPCWASPVGTGSEFYFNTNLTGFAVTWYCWTETKWVSAGFYGRWSELPAEWRDIVSSLMKRRGTVDPAGLWIQHVGDTGLDYTEVKPLLAELHAKYDPLYHDAPPQMKSDGGPVYYAIQQRDKLILPVVGSVPAGIVCDASQSINGMYAVPRTFVTWAGNVQPLVVVTKCK